MLIWTTMPAVGTAPHHRQSGVVLMMALIVLVAMTLAGIALVRSVDTSNVIAGNLAFKQAATNAADAGTEAAVTWLETNNTPGFLWNDHAGQGYVSNGLAVAQNPGVGQTWDTFWNAVLVPNGQVVALPQDASGNTVSYTIQRMCFTPNLDPTAGAGCAQPQTLSITASSSKTAGTVALLYSSQIFYRITARIVGPRNTVSYVQTIVALS